ncbi:MAG: hypothetical protein ACTSRG_13225 [Candidatus Helarchaeota archaeon]
MKIRSFPTYWYHKRIFKLPNEKMEEKTITTPQFKTKIEKIDSSSTKKSK